MVISSAYIASLIGVFVGRFSSGLMVGIVYIKIIMILFLAPPILFYLFILTDSMVYLMAYLFPSSAAFYGLMDLLDWETDRLWLNFVVLAIHVVVLSCFYFFIAIKRRNGNILSRLIIKLLNNKTYFLKILTDVL